MEVPSLAWSCPLLADPPTILNMLAEPLQKNSTSKNNPMRMMMVGQAVPLQLMSASMIERCLVAGPGENEDHLDNVSGEHHWPVNIAVKLSYLS